MNRLIQIITVTILTLSLCSPLNVYATGEVTGRINASDRPEITKVEIRDTADYEATDNFGNGNVVTTLTPNMYFDIIIGMNQLGTFDNLDKLDIKLWFDGTGSANLKTDYDSIPDVLADSQSVAQTSMCINLIYDESDNDNIVVSSNAGANTWEVYSHQVPLATATSGDFIVRVKVGKVATEATSTDTPRWQIATYVEDIALNSDYMAGASNTMNWYGETVVPDSHNVRFDNVEGGFDYTQSAAVQKVFSGEGNEKITYISNGNYTENVKVTTEWSKSYGSGAVSKIDRDNALSEDNTFSFKFDYTGTYTGGTATVIDDTSNTTVTVLYNSGSITAETGQDRSDYYMYLATSSTFPNSSVYDGLIVFGIANR